jgi:hypothetical protein
VEVPGNSNPSNHKKGRLSLRIQESKEMFGGEELSFLCRGFLFRVRENNPEMECFVAHAFQIHLFRVTSAG